MIVYQTTLGEITSEQLTGFFEGWPNPPTPTDHLRILRGSDCVVLAIDELSGNVVGFITAISDGVLSAYIPLLEVLPEHRGHGIGTELTRRMLATLDELNPRMIDLMCDPGLVPFYVRFGMRTATGMVIRRQGRRSDG